MAALAGVGPAEDLVAFAEWRAESLTGVMPADVTFAEWRAERAGAAAPAPAAAM